MKQLISKHSYSHYIGDLETSESYQLITALNFQNRRNTMLICSRLKNKKVFTPSETKEVKILSHAEIQDYENKQESRIDKSIKRVQAVERRKASKRNTNGKQT